MDDLFAAFDAPAKAPSGANGAGPAAAGAAAAAPLPQAYTKEKRAADAAAVAQRDADAAAAKRAGKRARREPADATVVSLGTESERLTTKINVESVKDCVHEVAVPPGYPYVPMSETRPPAKPAKKYKFVLDPFQQQAVACLERTESVLVAAHTSAGKTVVAEYAIAMSLRDGQRVIYTSPIKALSNQKFRELQEEFSDVGLMTGDVTINPSASCLVMTTEILRSMMYRGSEVMREVGWVIFDEVHYMRDKERGVVWEETMILLPDNVHYVFLSATIPNALQFARWIAELHSQPCHVVYTEYRPTPLMHYLFPAGGDGLHLVVDERGEFREESFMRAMAALSDKPQGGGGGGGKGGKRGGKGGGASEIMTVISTMMKRNLNPILVFSFSKRDCESHALNISKLDFNDDEEKALVRTVFSNAMDALSEEDRRLPQVEQVLPLLQRGIGIHHGGLLPILKEVIEILFGEGLVKVLFATETFAMGLNMPAKTVIFTGVRKFDGRDFRWVSSGEYIQMSGRAGRRGLDDRGLVILMCDEKMEPTIGRGILRGLPDKLNSAYHLTYHTVLNLLVQEEINPETILEKSFFQFQNQQALPEMERQLAALTAELEAIEIEDEDSVSELHDLQVQQRLASRQLQRIVAQPEYAVPYLNPGRLVKVRDGETDWGWGAVVNFSKKKVKKRVGEEAEPEYVVEVLLNCATGPSAAKSVHPVPCPPDERGGEMKVIPVLLDLVEAWSSVRLYMPKDVRPLDARQSVGKSIAEVKKRFEGSVPLLDPVADMKIPKKVTADVLSRAAVLDQRLKAHPLCGDPSVEPRLQLCARKRALGDEIKALKKQIRKSNGVIKLDELKARKRVLRRLDFATAGDVITLKGRVACCISTGDELVLTELIFNGVFNDLGPAECCSLASVFVTDEKSENPPMPPKAVAAAVEELRNTARRLCKVYTECKLEVDETEYVAGFSLEMVAVALAWAKGASFLEVTKMTDMFEGAIIRVMRRLEELLRQLSQAAKAIGNTELEQKFATAISLIKRDIIFHPSLYL